MPARSDGVFAPRRRALTVGVLLAVTSFALEGMGVVPALPTAVRELGGLPLFGWAFAAFMLAWLVGTVFAGALADARGPRTPMALGLIAFAGGLVLAGTAHGMAQFLLGRALQGAGGGAMIAAAYVAIALGYPDALRPRMMALTASVWILPALLGPAGAGAVTERLGWRLVFLGVAPAVAATALVVLPPLTPFERRVPFAAPGQLFAAARVALGAALLLATPELRVHGALAVGGAALAGVSLLGPALRTVLPPGTLRAAPGLPAGMAARALVAFAFFGTEAFIPLGASALRGVSPAVAGLALTAGALGWIGAAWSQDRLEARGPERRADRMLSGFLLVALGIAVVGAGLVTAAPFALVPLGWAVSGAGMGLSYSAGSLLCLAAAPAGAEGDVSGRLQLAEALGTALATGLGGEALAALVRWGRTPREGQAAIFAGMIAVALLGAAISRRARPAPA